MRKQPEQSCTTDLLLLLHVPGAEAGSWADRTREIRQLLLHMRTHKPSQLIRLKISSGYYISCHLPSFPLI